MKKNEKNLAQPGFEPPTIQNSKISTKCSTYWATEFVITNGWKNKEIRYYDNILIARAPIKMKHFSMTFLELDKKVQQMPQRSFYEL